MTFISQNLFVWLRLYGNDSTKRAGHWLLHTHFTKIADAAGLGDDRAESVPN